MNKTYARIYSNHFGKIMSNLSIFGVVLMALILLSSVVFIFFYMFSLFLAFSIIVATFGTIFIAYPNFIQKMVGMNGSANVITLACYKAFPYIFGVTLATAIVSLVFLCIDKERRSVPRIVFSGVVIGLTIVIGLTYLLGGLGAWTH